MSSQLPLTVPGSDTDTPKQPSIKTIKWSYHGYINMPGVAPATPHKHAYHYDPTQECALHLVLLHHPRSWCTCILTSPCAGALKWAALICWLHGDDDIRN